MCHEIGAKRLLFAPLNATDETVNTLSMSQLTIQISEKGDALIAQLQKEIFQRRRKKVSAEGVIETLIESGAKSQSDKRFAASWQNLVADIEKAAKVAQTHGAKPANLSDAEWALVLAHRTRTGLGEADKPKGRTSPSRTSPSRSRSTTTRAAAKPRTSRSAAPARSASSSAPVSSTSSRAKATSSRSKAASSRAKASAKALALAAQVTAPDVAEGNTAALGETFPVGDTPVGDTFSPATPPAAATTTRRTRTRSTASNGAKPRTTSSPAARRMAKAATRLSIGSTASKAASPKATPAAPIPVSYPSADEGLAVTTENPAG
ncbi:hypothetical protein LBMAG40_01220 [Cyanobium sp.]|nr:hypothetical protein LBMAG40_01220 [Cyanobium sp.]